MWYRSKLFKNLTVKHIGIKKGVIYYQYVFDVGTYKYYMDEDTFNERYEVIK